MDSKKTLSCEQVRRLDGLLREKYEIHGVGHFPTLELEPRNLLALLKKRLKATAFENVRIRLHGSAASYVVREADEKDFNDLDFLFDVDLTNDVDFQHIREIVLSSLVNFMPVGVSTARLGASTLEEAYVDKMVKVFGDYDRWSLISLRNNRGRNVELKFVGRMRRPYQFSVDSLQIDLDSYLAYTSASSPPLSPDFYPSVDVESMYEEDDVETVLDHLDRKIVATKRPEEIRGGGLLKYCSLVARGYRPTDECRSYEPYMCSRFFIDFPDIMEIRVQLANYLDAHFRVDDSAAAPRDFLATLHAVVNSSTVCLMSYERRQALHLIRSLASRFGDEDVGGDATTLPGSPASLSPPPHHRLRSPPTRQIRPGGSGGTRTKQRFYGDGGTGGGNRRHFYPHRRPQPPRFENGSGGRLVYGPVMSSGDGCLVWLVPVDTPTPTPVYQIDF